MTLVRERRKKQPLRLNLPPNDFLPCVVSPPPLSSSSSTTTSSKNALSDFNELSVLGRGSGGTVYKVSHKQTGAIYALKVVRFRQNVESVIREAGILQRVDSCKCVVQCLNVFDADVDHGGKDGLCFLMEYMDGGSLQNVLRKKKTLSENVISFVARSVLKGLQYLHGVNQVVHRDIKPSNLLVSMKGELKIADFGSSRAVGPVGGGANLMTSWSTCVSSTPGGGCRGTCAYMSPERMDPERWDPSRECDGRAGDVWALGVVAMECYLGYFPLVGPGQTPNWVTLIWAICYERKSVESAVGMGSPEFVSFCKRCLERGWRDRGTVEELLLHPFVLKYDEINGVEDFASCIQCSSSD